MESKNEEAARQGCIQLVDMVVFAFGSLMMFGNTAALLSKFAGDNWLGLTGMQNYQGLAEAMVIEGVLIYFKLKFWIFPPRTLTSWAFMGFTTLVTFLLSAFAQVANGWITTDYLSTLPKDTQTFVSIAVPSLIAVPVMLMIFSTIVETAPTYLFGGLKLSEQSEGSALGFVRGLFGGVGKKSVGKNPQPETQVLAKDVEQVALVKARGKARVGKNNNRPVNPTSGKAD